MNIVIGLAAGVGAWVVLTYVGRFARRLWAEEEWTDDDL